jgi:hypothetical protein
LNASILLTSRKSLVSLLATITVSILAADYFGQDYAEITSNILNLIITTPLVAISIFLLIKEGNRGDFGRGWICFVVFVVLWYTAERIWTVYEIIYRVDPWPSEADFFWLAGYPFYIAFAIFYLKPFKNAISLKTVVFAIGVSLAISGFLTYHTWSESNLDDFETVLGLSYPLADAMSLVPIIVGLVLFFRGEMNFLLSCLLIGMLCFVAADYGFLVLSLDETYYTGHPIDIPYIWAYLLFVFGAYNRSRMFTRPNDENRFNFQEKFR